MESKVIAPIFLEHVSPNYKYMHEDKSNSVFSFYANIRFSCCLKYRSEEYISYSCYKVLSNISMSYFFEKYGK